MYGSLLGIAPALDVRRDILQYHDSVVDDHTDGDGERGERYDVQRVPRDEEVDERGDKRYRDREDDDEGRTPAPEEEEDDEHHDHEGDDDGLLERIDRIDDKARGIDEVADLNVRGEVLLDLGKGSTDLTSDLDRVRAFLLRDHDDSTALPIDEVLLLAFPDGVLDLCDVAQIDILPADTRHDDRAELHRIGEFPLHTDRVGTRAEVNLPRRDVHILRTDELGDLRQSEVVSLELRGVTVDLHDALRGTRDIYRPDAIDALQAVADTVFQELRQPRGTLLGLDREDGHGDRARTELKDRRLLSPRRQVIRDRIELVTDIIRSLRDGSTSAELQRDDRGIVLTLRGNMLETVDTIERVLKGLGDVRLNIRGAGTGIGGDDHDVGRLGLRHQLDRESREREEPKYRYRHIDQGGSDGLPYGGFVNTHSRRLAELLTELDREPVLEVRGRRGDDLISSIEPTDDLIEITLLLTKLYRTVDGLATREDIDIACTTTRLTDDSLVGYGEGFLRTEVKVHTGIHPWAELEILVRHLDLGRYRMRDRVKRGEDIRDDTTEGLFAESIDGEGRCCALLQVGVVLLGDADNSLDGCDLLDDDDRELGRSHIPIVVVLRRDEATDRATQYGVLRSVAVGELRLIDSTLSLLPLCLRHATDLIELVHTGEVRLSVSELDLCL